MPTRSWSSAAIAALGEFERARGIFERALGPKHFFVAFDLLGKGQAELGLHHPRAAVAPLERALAIRESSGASVSDLAATRFLLASALWDTGGNRARAVELAASARKGFASSDERHRADLAEVDQWMARHR